MQPKHHGRTTRHPAAQQQLAKPISKGARKEVYGFVGWMTSFVAFGAYLMWALLSDSMLHEMGIYYYPDRWWAVAIPIYAVMVTAYGAFIYYIINLMNTAPLNSISTIRDNYATQVRKAEPLSPEAIPPIADIDISVVNKMIFLDDS